MAGVKISKWSAYLIDELIAVHRDNTRKTLQKKEVADAAIEAYAEQQDLDIDDLRESFDAKEAAVKREKMKDES